MGQRENEVSVSTKGLTGNKQHYIQQNCKIKASPMRSQHFWTKTSSPNQPPKHLPSALKTAFCKIFRSLFHLSTTLQYFWKTLPYLSCFFWLHIPFLNTSNSPFHNSLSEGLSTVQTLWSQINLTGQREQN